MTSPHLPQHPRTPDSPLSPPAPRPEDADVLARMERNVAEHACHLHRSLAGASVTETDELVIADSGLADDTFNIVAAARFTPEDAPARIAGRRSRALQEPRESSRSSSEGRKPERR